MNSPVPTKRASLSHEVEETGEVVVFDQGGNQLLLLNDIGAAVWVLLDGERSISDIAGVIIETLPADRETVEKDVGSFLEELVSHGVVELR